MTVFSTVSSMSQLDFEEVKDYVGRQDLAHRLLEQSVRDFAAECDERIAAMTSERDALASKVTQLEILLKGRHGALIAKEEECQRLKSQAIVCTRPRLTLTHLSGFELTASSILVEEKEKNPWMSVSGGIARFECLKIRELSAVSLPDPVVLYESQSAASSPISSPAFKRLVSRAGLRDSVKSPVPATAFRRRSVSSDSDSDVPVRRMRDSFASIRTSFGTVRSSVVESVSDDSDASLDELVSQAMRLSRSSVASSRNSGVVRGSTRLSTNSFPRRW